MSLETVTSLEATRIGFRLPSSHAARRAEKSMTFHGQMDSIGDEISLADVGLIYVFVCVGCFETTSLLQSS
jgi:hypothetical protein